MVDLSGSEGGADLFDFELKFEELLGLEGAAEEEVGLVFGIVERKPVVVVITIARVVEKGGLVKEVVLAFSAVETSEVGVGVAKALDDGAGVGKVAELVDGQGLIGGLERSVGKGGFGPGEGFEPSFGGVGAEAGEISVVGFAVNCWREAVGDKVFGVDEDGREDGEEEKAEFQAIIVGEAREEETEDKDKGEADHSDKEEHAVDAGQSETVGGLVEIYAAEDGEDEEKGFGEEKNGGEEEKSGGSCHGFSPKNTHKGPLLGGPPIRATRQACLLKR